MKGTLGGVSRIKEGDSLLGLQQKEIEQKRSQQAMILP